MTKNHEQKSEEWYEARKGRITGSVVGAILGLAPYMTREDVLRQMVRDYHGAANEFETNPAIGWGVANEATATAMFELETGKKVSPVGFLPFGDRYGASPDGLIGGHAVFECKCPFSARKEAKFKTLAEQPHYVAQLEFEMKAAGVNKAYFWQWSPHGHSLTEYDSCQSWWDAALPELDAFWSEYLSELDNPSHLEPKRVDLTGNNRAVMLVAEYDDLREAKDNAEERMKKIIAELSNGGKNAIIGDRKLTKVAKEGAISYAKAIKALCPTADLEPFRGKASEYWRLS